jgi:phospholipid/cholesterol/gamma-HCH transport system substrate-binding protein
MIREEDPRLRYLETKIGVFAVCALLGIIAGLVFIGLENDFFTRKFTLTFTVPKGTSFTKGMPVKLSGFRIGRVKSIALNEQAAVDVVLQIDEKYQKWVRHDSTARLHKEGLVGDPVIEVSVGSPAQPPLGNAGRITFVKSRGLDELATDLEGQLRPVLAEVREMLVYLNSPDSDVRQALRNLSLLTRNLETSRQQVDILLGHAREDVDGVTRRLEGLLAQTDRKVEQLGPTLEKIDRTVATVEKSLPEMLRKGDAALDNLEKITREARAASEQSFPRVPAMVRQSEYLVDDTGEVVNAVKGIWPISSKIPQPEKGRLVPGDSHE